MLKVLREWSLMIGVFLALWLGLFLLLWLSGAYRIHWAAVEAFIVVLVLSGPGMAGIHS